MKNSYKFLLLQKEEIEISAVRKSEIFFSMLDFIEGRKPTGVVDTIDELAIFMRDDFYYIAHKILVAKGKTRLFKGELVLASKKSILDFVKLSIENDDLRSLILAPVFEIKPNYVIFIHDDPSFFQYT